VDALQLTVEPLHLLPHALLELVLVLEQLQTLGAEASQRSCQHTHASSLRPRLDPKFFDFDYCSIFVCIWQLVSNYGLIRFKSFVSRFLTQLCN